ncbi:MAG: hypothetical protein H0W84_05970 [Bacteroidetes bacterium]|nr:hypothetical protein [Bacteroidota bacterium]
MKDKLLIFLIILTLTSFTYSDKKNYKEIAGESYHPIVLGQKHTYTADLTKYTMYFDSSFTELGNKKYIKETIDYGDSQTFVYYREENKNIIYFKPDQKQETIEIPAIITIGMVWYESDSTWKYTITGIKETFETPTSIFLNCLVIQSENIDRKANPKHYRLYLQYYQRGRGYIGTKLGGLVYSYLNMDE